MDARSLLAFAALACFAAQARAQADDSTGSWAGSQEKRRPVELSRQRELEAAVDEMEQDQRAFDRERFEFEKDRAALELARRARAEEAERARAAAQADKARRDSAAALVADPTTDAEMKRLEERARERLGADGQRKVEPPPVAAPPRAHEPTPQPELTEQERRELEKARAAQRKEGEADAKKLGGGLDKDGQFVDPELDKR